MCRSGPLQLSVFRKSGIQPKTVQPAGFCPFYVVLPVTDHHDFAFYAVPAVFFPDLSQRQSDDVRFCRELFVHSCSHHLVKIPEKIKMLQDPPHIDLRLRGGYHKTLPPSMQGLQQLRYALQHPVLEDTHGTEAFSVDFQCLYGLFLTEPVKIHEGRNKRRPDEGPQFFQIRHLNAEVAQCMLNGFGDALLGIGQRPVQIKQQISVHEC